MTGPYAVVLPACSTQPGSTGTAPSVMNGPTGAQL